VTLGGEKCFPCFVVFTLQKQMTEVINYRRQNKGLRRKRRSGSTRRSRRFTPPRSIIKQDTGVFDPYAQGLWGSLIANFSFTLPLTRVTNGTLEYQRGNDCQPHLQGTTGQVIIYQEVNTICTYRFIGVTTHSPYVNPVNMPQLDLLYNFINPVTILTGPLKKRQDQTPMLFTVWHDSFITVDTNSGCTTMARKVQIRIPPAKVLFQSQDSHGDSGLGMQFIVILTDAPVANANYSMQFNAIRTFHCNR
jgi:hypothetical protein